VDVKALLVMWRHSYI